MDLSGTNTITVDSRGQVKSRVEWSATQDYNANTSTITVRVYSYFQYAVNSSAASNVDVDIAGQKQSVSRVIGNHPNGVDKLVATVTKIVQHATNGKLTAKIKVTNPFRITYAGVYLNAANHDFNIILKDIPRESKVGALSDMTLPTNSPTFRIDAQVAAYRHTADLKVDGVIIATMTNLAGGNHTFTLTEAQKTNILNRIKNSTSKKFTVTIGTYNGNTRVGAWSSREATAYVAASVVPIINSVVHSEANELLKNQYLNIYLNKMSRVNIKTDASGVYGSTIKEIKITDDRRTYTGSNVTTEPIDVRDPDHRSWGATVTVTDSRGRTAIETIHKTSLVYITPYLDMFGGGGVPRVYRVRKVNETGGGYHFVEDAEEGTGIEASFYMRNPLFDTTDRPWWAYMYIKKYGETEWTWIKTEESFYSSTAMFNYLNVDTIDTINVLYSYDVKVVIDDGITETEFLFQVPSGFTTLDFLANGKGVAVGKISEKEAFEVAFPTEIKDRLGVFAKTSNPTDNQLLRFHRLDGTLHSAFMYNESDQSLRLHFFSKTGVRKTYYSFSEDGIITSGADTGWINVSFNTGWGNHNPRYTSVQYRRIGKAVYLRGLARRSTGTDVNICTLPAGFRPLKDSVFPSRQEAGGSDIYLTSGGLLAITSKYVTGAWVTLDDIVFFID